MTINRRSFLGALTASSAALPLAGLARAGFGSTLFARLPFESHGCALVDLKSSCKLPESLAGYESGLKTIGADYVRATAESVNFCQLMIVPGFAGGTRMARIIREAAERGSTVLLESGALFDDPWEFENHRRLLSAYFSIDVQAPIALWENREGKAHVNFDSRHSSPRSQALSSGMASLPYVDYAWPHAAKIRDFSRALPVSSEDGEVIAVAPGGIPVAVKAKLGRGMMIFLGSPVGPAILAGDREACEWMRAVVSQTCEAF